jgi:hypothetical protein
MNSAAPRRAGGRQGCTLFARVAQRSTTRLWQTQHLVAATPASHCPQGIHNSPPVRKSQKENIAFDASRVGADPPHATLCVTE